MRRLLPALLLLLGVSTRQDPAGRPNVLWITCEDISPNVGCYGDATAVTPNRTSEITASLKNFRCRM